MPLTNVHVHMNLLKNGPLVLDMVEINNVGLSFRKQNVPVLILKCILKS